VDIPELAAADDALGVIVLWEAWEVHAPLYRAEAERYGPGTRALLEMAAQIPEADYRSALADADRVAAGFARALDEADILAGPTMAFVAPPEDPPFNTPEGAVEARFTGPCNLARVPAVTLPCGPAEHGLPAALQLMAAVGRDSFLLSVAATYEAVGVR
jgi:aspartyl-tRNA(Asn)/glutamyl-tRNA(Gln) amidotransferase subunit A